VNFYIDECVTPHTVSILKTLFMTDCFYTPSELNLLSCKDIPLFSKLHDEGIQVLITRDLNQLRNQSERQALKESGLNWVGLRGASKSGIAGIALDTATLVAALPFVRSELGSLDGVPTSFRLKGAGKQSEQHFTSAPL